MNKYLYEIQTSTYEALYIQTSRSSQRPTFPNEERSLSFEPRRFLRTTLAAFLFDVHMRDVYQSFIELAKRERRIKLKIILI